MSSLCVEHCKWVRHENLLSNPFAICTLVQVLILRTQGTPDGKQKLVLLTFWAYVLQHVSIDIIGSTFFDYDTCIGDRKTKIFPVHILDTDSVPVLSLTGDNPKFIAIVFAWCLHNSSLSLSSSYSKCFFRGILRKIILKKKWSERILSLEI